MCRRLWLCGWVATSLWLSYQTMGWACPMCKMALETDDPQPRAYMVSILFMLGTIGTVFGAVIGGLVWISRAERRQLEEAGYHHVLHNAVDALQYPASQSNHTAEPREC